LPPAQARLWRELAALPDPFVLYGGTALALHLGHRNSVDFDFFAREPLNLPQLESEIPFLAAAHALYGPTFNPEVTLKALCYFDDGNLRDLPSDLKHRLVEAAREVDLDHLPLLGAELQRANTDHGLE
jgi:hypothetical protein